MGIIWASSLSGIQSNLRKRTIPGSAAFPGALKNVSASSPRPFFSAASTCGCSIRKLYIPDLTSPGHGRPRTHPRVATEVCQAVQFGASRKRTVVGGTRGGVLLPGDTRSNSGTKNRDPPPPPPGPAMLYSSLICPRVGVYGPGLKTTGAGNKEGKRGGKGAHRRGRR